MIIIIRLQKDGTIIIYIGGIVGGNRYKHVCRNNARRSNG